MHSGTLSRFAAARDRGHADDPPAAHELAVSSSSEYPGRGRPGGICLGSGTISMIRLLRLGQEALSRACRRTGRTYGFHRPRTSLAALRSPIRAARTVQEALRFTTGGPSSHRGNSDARRRTRGRAIGGVAADNRKRCILGDLDERLSSARRGATSNRPSDSPTDSSSLWLP